MDYTHGSLKDKRLLVVEDDSFLQSLLATKLTPLISEGVILQPALDGELALTLAQEHRPDIILLDILLPGMTGYEFLERMQKADPTFREVPVIIFSNLSSQEDHERAKSLGVRTFMSKSEVTIAEIVDQIEKELKATLTESKPH